MRSRDRSIILVFLGVLVLGVAALTLSLTPPPASEEAGPAALPAASWWRPSPEAVAQQRALDATRLEGFVIGADEEAFLKDLARFHHVEIRTRGDRHQKKYREATEAQRLRAQRYLRDHGMERYVQLGMAARQRFLAALQHLAEDAARSGTTLAKQVVRQPDRAEVRTIRELGGNFLDFAVRVGLMDELGRTDLGRAFVIATLFKIRWLRWVEEVYPPDANLTRLEQRTVLAYRVEAHPGLSLGRRLQILHALRSVDPSYPADRVEARLLIRAGHLARAARFLDEALKRKPGDAALARLRARVERELESRGRAGDSTRGQVVPP